MIIKPGEVLLRRRFELVCLKFYTTMITLKTQNLVFRSSQPKGVMRSFRPPNAISNTSFPGE